MKKEKIANTEKIMQELDAMSERINAIKAEINKPEKVVVNGVEMEYGINTVRWTYSPTYSKQGIQALYDPTNSPELKTILDGFNKQK